jgi:hypothetical protein
MTTMPIIDDRMVDQFRRTGKRRSSYRSVTAVAQRVVLQRSPQCHVFDQDCFGRHGEPGRCDEKLDCIIDPFPGGDHFRF